MGSNIKKKVSIFLGMAVFLTALFASSLSQLAFQPGMPPPAMAGGRFVLSGTPYSRPVNFPINGFFLYLLAGILAAYLLVMLYKLAMGANWKKLLAGLLKFSLVTTGAFLILALIILLLPTFQIKMDEMPLAPTPPPMVTAPLGQPPVSLLLTVGAVIAVLVAFLIISILTARHKIDHEAQLALEVEKAHQNLLAGLDLKEVILRCYQQMSQILQQEGGIERRDFMTPAEFERLLSMEGFPPTPVHQLTTLFEFARYGNWTPNPWDEQKARESLQGIIDHLRMKKGSSTHE